MDELTLLAELAPQQGTVAGTQHAEKQVRGETAIVEVARDTPAGDALGRTDLANEVSATDATLGRLLVPGDVDERATRETTEPTFGRGEDFLRRHAAAQGEHDVRGDVAASMIRPQIIRSDAYEKIAMADHRLAQRMRTHRLLEDGLGQHLVVLVVAHRDFT